MSRIAVATPVANSNMLRMDASRLSLWTSAIAISAQTACRYKQNHFIPVTCDWLSKRRWRRASIAFCKALMISRWAICWPAPTGCKLSVNCRRHKNCLNYEYQELLLLQAASERGDLRADAQTRQHGRD